MRANSSTDGLSRVFFLSGFGGGGHRSREPSRFFPSSESRDGYECVAASAVVESWWKDTSRLTNLRRVVCEFKIV